MAVVDAVLAKVWLFHRLPHCQVTNCWPSFCQVLYCRHIGVVKQLDSIEPTKWIFPADLS
jgi:hypothetical protein